MGEGPVIRDAAVASRLRNRHHLGEWVEGGLRLSPIEAAWCAAGDRLPGLPDVAAILGESAEAQTAYLVYSDLRERGLVVRQTRPAEAQVPAPIHVTPVPPATGSTPEHPAAPFCFAVWPRGVGMAGPPEYLVRPFADDESVTASDLLASAASGEVAAIVDADGAVTHYSAHRAEPTGTWMPGTLPAAAGKPLARGVLVEGPAAATWWESERIGTMVPGGLLLAPAEAHWLAGRGVLTLDPPPPPAPFQAIHDALRERGVLARSGFKFGTELRAYDADPADAHAPWLVAAGQGALRWVDLARGVRIAHGVRKQFLVAIADPRPAPASRPAGALDPGVAFVGLAWKRP